MFPIYFNLALFYKEAMGIEIICSPSGKVLCYIFRNLEIFN